MSAAYYTVTEVAKLLRVNTTKVGTWIDSGELKAINVGSGQKVARYRISQAALDKFLESRTTVKEKPAAKPKRREKYTGPIYVK